MLQLHALLCAATDKQESGATEGVDIARAKVPVGSAGRLAGTVDKGLASKVVVIVYAEVTAL